MGFFKVLGFIFLFFFLLNLVFRLFGRQILLLLMRSIFKPIMKDFDAQSKAYQRNYGRDPYADQIQLDDHTTLKRPPTAEKKRINADEIAEDIEFEETQ